MGFGRSLKNVWTSDKSWEPGSFLMFSYVFQCFLTFSNVTYFHSHSHSLSLSHSLTISLFLTLTLFQSLIQSLSTCWTTFVFISMLKTHPHTFSLSLAISLFVTLTLFQSLIQSLSTWWTSFVFISMLKTHCLLLKIAMVFLDIHITLSCDSWVHRAGSQLKSDKFLLGIVKDEMLSPL